MKLAMDFLKLSNAFNYWLNIETSQQMEIVEICQMVFDAFSE
jgi:hypothetical protein